MAWRDRGSFVVLILGRPYRLASIPNFQMRLSTQLNDPHICGASDAKGSSKGGGGRHLGGGATFCTFRRRGIQNKEHFKRRNMEFLLMSWSGDEHSYVKLRTGTKIP